MFKAVLYISSLNFSSETANEDQIRNIKKTSIASNKKNNISGVLALNKKHFLHVIEGEKNTIDTLLDNIKNDDRNKNLSVVLDLEISEKIYPDWEMIESYSAKQSQLLSLFLQRSIDDLPMIEQEQHDILEEFINEIFH